MSLQSSIGSCGSNGQFSLNLMHHNQFQASNLNSCSTNSENKYGLCLNSNQVNSQLNLSQNNTNDQSDLHHDHQNDTNIDSPTPLSPKKVSLKDSIKCRYVLYLENF